MKNKFVPGCWEIAEKMGVSVRGLDQLNPLDKELLAEMPLGAYYTVPDEIYLNPEYLKTPMIEGSLVLLHEILHATGRPGRMKRNVLNKIHQQTDNQGKTLKPVSMSEVWMEERIAEIGGKILAMRLGIGEDLCDNWISITGAGKMAPGPEQEALRQALAAVEFLEKRGYLL